MQKTRQFKTYGVRTHVTRLGELQSSCDLEHGESYELAFRVAQKNCQIFFVRFNFIKY